MQKGINFRFIPFIVPRLNFIRRIRRIQIIFSVLWLCEMLKLGVRWLFPFGFGNRVCFFSSGWKVERSVS